MAQYEQDEKFLKEILIEEDSDYLDLEVKQSQIKGAGKGLFAKRNFKEGEFISEYRGKVIKAQYGWHQLFDHEDRMVWINDDYCILGKNVAQFANDCIDFQPDKYGKPEYQNWINSQKFPLVKNMSYNAEIEPMFNKAFLVAIRDIVQGEEIFVAYGFAYWQHFYEQEHAKKMKSLGLK